MFGTSIFKKYSKTVNDFNENQFSCSKREAVKK